MIANWIIVQRMSMPLVPLLVLSLLLVASSLVFVTLIRRATSHRVRLSLLEWSRERGFHLGGPTVTMPPPIVELANPDLRVQWILNSDATTLVQLLDRPGENEGRWHLLIRKTVAKWPPTALRPAGDMPSAVDLFSLESFPMLPVNERYKLVGTDPSRARQLGASAAAGLLPAGIGLLLHGEYLVLDFSSRPFDGIEFGRIIALADQVERAIQRIGGAIPA
jgi:hypothetical protein